MSSSIVNKCMGTQSWEINYIRCIALPYNLYGSDLGPDTTEHLNIMNMGFGSKISWDLGAISSGSYCSLNRNIIHFIFHSNFA